MDKIEKIVTGVYIALVIASLVACYVVDIKHIGVTIIGCFFASTFVFAITTAFFESKREINE